MFAQQFPNGAMIHLTSVACNGNLCCDQANQFNGKGQTGPWATWRVHNQGQGFIRLEREQGQGCFLAINNNMLCVGQGGPFCNLIPEPLPNGTFCFAAQTGQGRVGIMEGGQAKPANQTGQGIHGQFRVVHKAGMGMPGMGQPGMGMPGMGQPGMGMPGMGQPGMGMPGQGGMVLKAQYHNLDVTQRVQQMANQNGGMIRFAQNYHLLFGDPAPGVAKMMTIQYRNAAGQVLQEAHGDFQHQMFQINLNAGAGMGMPGMGQPGMGMPGMGMPGMGMPGMGMPVKSHLMVNESLQMGAKLTSPNGRFHATYQQDGNFVVYANGNQAIWASMSNGKGGNRIQMQADNNLVIYTAQNQAVWNSGSCNKGMGGGKCQMQDDGNFVLYDGANRAVWCTRTDNGQKSPHFGPGQLLM